MNRRIFITGNGTDIGKTLVAAILCEALKADYWKPIQAGSLENSDSDFVKRMITNSESKIHPETFLLSQPMSPHAAAKIDGVKIRLSDFSLPKTKNILIIEGAGGLLVPINEKKFVADLIKEMNAEVVIVCKNYLGSINHSLLTVEAAKKRKLNVRGIIFNGEPNEESEKIILKHTSLKMLGRILPESEISRETVLKYAQRFSKL